MGGGGRENSKTLFYKDCILGSVKNLFERETETDRDRQTDRQRHRETDIENTSTRLTRKKVSCMHKISPVLTESVGIIFYNFSDHRFCSKQNCWPSPSIISSNPFPVVLRFFVQNSTVQRQYIIITYERLLNLVLVWIRSLRHLFKSRDRTRQTTFPECVRNHTLDKGSIIFNANCRVI